MSISTRLLLLVASILLPMLAGAAYGLHLMRTQQLEQATQSVRELAAALADSVERELAVKESVLRSLAVSPALQKDDIAAFYQHARAAAPTFDRTLVLHQPSGAQVMNTRLPLDAKLPARSSLTDEREAAGEDATVVSDLYFAPVGKQFSYAVQVPVKRDGKLVYYLSMGNFASGLQRLLDEQTLRPGWNASIVDRRGIIVARRVRPQEFVGKPATDQFRARMKAAPAGVFETVRLDGTPVITAYTPAGSSGWTVAVSMPKAELAELSRDVARFMATLTAGLVLVALSAAWFLARSINASVLGLVSMARALGRGEEIMPPSAGMRETRLVAAELAAAGSRLRALNETLEARVRAAVRESEQAQQALLQHQKLEALGRLTGGIAHDFNNILQTLNVSVEVAQRMAVRDSVKAALETGKRAVQRGTQLTRQLLSFGRTQPGTRTVVDLAEHVRQSGDLLRGALRESVELRLALPPDLWPVDIDTVQLDLALLNVALNARDAMPGGGRLELRASNTPVAAGAVPDLPAGEYVCLCMEDTGVGIEPSVLPRVFEPFFTTKEVGKGSGLGLAQVYGFARQFGGTVTVHSRPGQGTRLLLYLPRSTKPLEAPSSPASAPAASAGGRTGAVLFVDDDPLIRRIMEPALLAEGFTVRCAATAQEALQRLAEAEADVMLSDIVMPGGMSGVDLAREARRRHPRLRILLATGFAASVPGDHGFRTLGKPYDIGQAAAAIREELASRAA